MVAHFLREGSELIGRVHRRSKELKQGYLTGYIVGLHLVGVRDKASSNDRRTVDVLHTEVSGDGDAHTTRYHARGQGRAWRRLVRKDIAVESVLVWMEMIVGDTSMGVYGGDTVRNGIDWSRRMMEGSKSEVTRAEVALLEDQPDAGTSD